MKILISIVLVLMFSKECISNKHDTITVPMTEINTTSDVRQQDVTIIYEATSRGYFEKIWITNDSLYITKDRNLAQKDSYLCSKEDWNLLTKLLKGVDLSELPSLEAPTSKRLYDGAAHASLSVKKDDTIIQSNSFDHGDPPKAIKELVNKMLSMAENAQKQ